MHPFLLAALADNSSPAAAMCVAGLLFLVIGGVAGRRAVLAAHGLDRIVALTNVCVAIPLAVFGALHLFGSQFVTDLVPAYMPWRLFWVYAVGCFLIAAALSIATRIGVRWSGLLFGIMMFSFVAMIHLPGALHDPHDRLKWVIVLRELSFGSAGWLLAANAMGDGRARRVMVGVARVLIAIALLVFGVEHFLLPLLLPGVPLAKEMPTWVPARVVIDYVTGAALIVTGGSALLWWRTRTVAAGCAAWLLLLVIGIYGPGLVAALSAPGIGAQLVGVNYFADALLFTGVILALASAAARKRPGATIGAPGLLQLND